MRQKIKSVSLASLMVLSVMSSLLIASVSVSASTVVITEAVQIVDGGQHRIRRQPWAPTVPETSTWFGPETTSTSTTR